jgi:hypothetical protein
MPDRDEQDSSNGHAGRAALAVRRMELHKFRELSHDVALRHSRLSPQSFACGKFCPRFLQISRLTTMMSGESSLQ